VDVGKKTGDITAVAAAAATCGLLGPRLARKIRAYLEKFTLKSFSPPNLNSTDICEPNGEVEEEGDDRLA